MSAVYNSTVQGFYLSYYGRPADPAGLTFWTGQLAAAGGNLSSILNAFGTSPEATRRYGTGTTESKIQAVYQQTFGRAADAAGLAFYNTEITAGRITLIDMSKRIIDGAAGDDVAIRNNRLSAAQSFTDKIDTDAEKAGYSGSGAEDAARTWIATVTKDAATVTAAVATADATITGLLPQVFALTSGQDKFTGTSGNDTFSGGSNALSSANTLGVTDQLDGGAGSDTATLTVTKDFAGFTSGSGFMKNVETVNLSNSTLTGYSFAAKGVTDVTTYNITGPVSVTGVAALSAQLNFSGVASALTLTGSFSDELVTGSSDTGNYGLTGLGAKYSGTASTPFADTSGNANTYVTLSSPSVETGNFTVTGDNFVNLTTTESFKAINVTGKGSLTMNAVTTALKTIDASAVEGAVNLNVDQADSMTSIKTGKGGDFISVTSAANADLRGDAAINAGDGADTLSFNLGTTNASGQYALTGVETLILGGTTGVLTFDASKSTGLTTIRAANTTSATHDITGLGSSPITVALATNSTSATATSTVKAATTGAGTVSFVVASGTTSSNFTTNGLSDDNVTFADSTSATISSTALSYYTGTLAAAKATAVTVSGAGRVNNTVTIDAATSLTVNQTSQNVAANDAGDWAIVVGKGSASTSALRTLDLTLAGKLALTGDITKTQSLTVATGNYFNPSAIAFGELNTVTLSGTTKDSQVKLGALGGTTLAYGTTISASGLAAGLEIGTVTVGSGQAISIDVSKVTTNASSSNTQNNTVIGALQAGSSTTSALSGSVTLNAKDMAATKDLIVSNAAAIHAKTINLDASGAAPTLINFASGSTITGENITIKANSAATTFSLGTIKVKDALTLTGSPLVATNGGTTTIDATAESTALTVNLSSSIGTDTINITGVSGNTSITVTGGDFSTADTISVNGAARTASTGMTINVSGLTGTGKTTITGSAGADTISGSKGADTITAGAGADTIDISQGGNDTIVYVTPSIDTASVTQITSSSGVTSSFGDTTTISSGSYVSTTSMDKIVGFAAGDIIQSNSIASGTTVSTVTALQTIGQARGTGVLLSDGTTSSLATYIDIMARGTYDAANNRFTFGGSGADTLYLMDANGGQGGTMHGVVLVGFAAGFGTPSSVSGLVGSAS